MRKSIEELLAAHKTETTAPALEVLEHVYQSLLLCPEFTLQDGRKACVQPFETPALDGQGEPRCGFDVRLDDGSHLEFTVRNTGWGRPLVGHADGEKLSKGKAQRHRVIPGKKKERASDSPIAYPDFVVRFPEGSEIGRLLTEEELAIYRDNGREVGVWRVNPKTSAGVAEILGKAESLAARRYFTDHSAERGR